MSELEKLKRMLRMREHDLSEAWREVDRLTAERDAAEKALAELLLYGNTQRTHDLSINEAFVVGDLEVVEEARALLATRKADEAAKEDGHE